MYLSRYQDNACPGAEIQERKRIEVPSSTPSSEIGIWTQSESQNFSSPKSLEWEVSFSQRGVFV